MTAFEKQKYGGDVEIGGGSALAVASTKQLLNPKSMPDKSTPDMDSGSSDVVMSVPLDVLARRQSTSQ